MERRSVNSSSGPSRLEAPIIGGMEAEWLNPESIVDRALRFAEPIRCQKGELVIHKGDRPDLLYYIQSGSVEVSSTVEDTKIVMAMIGAGNFFGEIGFFDRQPRTCDVTATEASDIFAFDEASIRNIRETDPRLYGDFICLVTQIISMRFRGVLEEQEPITAYAAALTRGKRSFDVSTPLPTQFFHSSDWRTVNRYVERFKAELYDLSYNLQEDGQSNIPLETSEKCFSMIDQFSERLQDMQGWDMDPDSSAYIWGYVFKEVFPYLMRSRFAERAYYKPQGYAGDYYMMEMIYRHQPGGDGKLGHLVDQWMLGSVPSEAVRGRRELLGRELMAIFNARHQGAERLQIMSLACGPAREFCDFITGCESSEAIDAFLVDIDPDALQQASANVNTVKSRASVRFMRENLIRWALGRVTHHFGQQDVIYSAGLTDYLGRSLFTALVRQCYEHLKPGGTLIIGNFGPANPHRAFMDHLLKWELIHRSEAELLEIFADTPFGSDDVEILSEKHGVNLFVRAVKGA